MNPSKDSRTYLTSSTVLLLFAGASGVGMAFVLQRSSLLIPLSCLPIALGFWLMHKGVGLFNLRVLTIPAYCYLIYVATVLIPAFFVFVDHPGPFRNTFLFAVESALLTIPLGILLTNHIFHFERREITGFFNQAMPECASDPGPEVYFLFLVIAWGITFLYTTEVRTIPLFYMLRHPGDPTYLGQLREESMKLLDSPLRYLYMILSHAFYPFLIALGFTRYLRTKRPSWGLLFLGSLIPGVLYAGFTIAKAPVAYICLLLCFSFYFYRGGRVGAKFILLIALSVIAFPLFVLLQEYKGEMHFGFVPALQAMGYRIFYLPANILYYYFEIFPHAMPFQYGRTIEKLAILMGGGTFDVTNVVGRYVYPDAPFSVTANAPFLGNLNADFGMPGVLVGGFLAGMIIQAAQIYVVRRGKSALSLALYVNFLHGLGDINAGALPVALLSGGPIFVLLLAWTMTTLDSVMLSALRIRDRFTTFGRGTGRPRRLRSPAGRISPFRSFKGETEE